MRNQVKYVDYKKKNVQGICIQAKGQWGCWKNWMDL